MTNIFTQKRIISDPPLANMNFLLAGTASTNPVLLILAILILAWKTSGFIGPRQHAAAGARYTVARDARHDRTDPRQGAARRDRLT